MRFVLFYILRYHQEHMLQRSNPLRRFRQRKRSDCVSWNWPSKRIDGSLRRGGYPRNARITSWRGRYASFSDYCRERFALARSTADQLCRSTQVFESLNATLAGSDTPVPETTPSYPPPVKPVCDRPGPPLSSSIQYLNIAARREGTLYLRL